MMRTLAAIGRELLGLFVDDARFALAIIVWLVIAGLIARLALIPPDWQAPLLFAGLAAILAWSCLDAIGRAASRRS